MIESIRLLLPRGERVRRVCALPVCLLAVTLSMSTAVAQKGAQKPGPPAPASERPPQCGTGLDCATGVAATVDALWMDADIGAPRVLGASATLDRLVAVAGAGTGFHDGTDQFHFTYQKLTGDGDLHARLASLEEVHPNAAAGVMVRRSLDPDAEHASLLATHKGGVDFQRRVVPGGNTLITATRLPAIGHWLKLERRGPVVKALSSSDGVTWKLIGSIELDLGDDVFVGLAVSSHKVNTPATAIFDALSLVALDVPVAPSMPAPEPDPGPAIPVTPDVVPPAPSTPESPAAPEAPAAPVEPTPPPLPTPAPSKPAQSVEQAPPPQPTPSLEPTPSPEPAPSPEKMPSPDPAPAWQPPPPPPGDSTAVKTPVLPVQSTTRVLAFEPSPDHDHAVDYYVFEILPVGASAIPVLSQELGKPEVVNGECRIDVSGLIAMLPAGLYQGVVRAINAAGSSAAAPLAPFQR